MSSQSRIEWTDATWNPVRGCTKVSPGCTHCYAETFAERFKGVAGHPYEQGFDLRLVPEKLNEPLHWRKPRMVFVNSMSDLFHDGVPEDFILNVFEVMRRADWHQFQVLTKRPDRVVMLNNKIKWPPNVWFGVSIETRKYLWRLDRLKTLGARLKFLSLEPLLGALGNFSLAGIDIALGSGDGLSSLDRLTGQLVQRGQPIRRGVRLHVADWGQNQDRGSRAAHRSPNQMAHPGHSDCHDPSLQGPILARLYISRDRLRTGLGDVYPDVARPRRTHGWAGAAIEG